jgi:hypothetical protein
MEWYNGGKLEEIMATLNIKNFPDELYHVIGRIAKKDRRSVTVEVIHLLEWAIEASAKEKTSILNLKGLGKEHWDNIDAADYINDERGSWE